METKTTSVEIETLYGVQPTKSVEIITGLKVMETVFGVQEIEFPDMEMELKVVAMEYGAATTALVAMETLSNERIVFYSYLII